MWRFASTLLTNDSVAEQITAELEDCEFRLNYVLECNFNATIEVIGASEYGECTQIAFEKWLDADIGDM